MAKLLKLIFWISTLTFLVSWWNYDNWIDDLQLKADLNDEPVQKPTRDAAFAVTSNEVDYYIKPLYDYELYGLVVSFRHHDGNFMLHRLWNDHLNVADVCVVWGENAADLDLTLFEFWNAEFTCYVQTGSDAAWRAFDWTGLSNNHLLTEKDHIRRAIQSVQVGDQIHFSGFLAEYSNADGFHRGSSTVRTDEGNGACETIYLESFRVIEPMRSLWRTLFDPAWISALISAFVWLVGVARGTY